MLFRFSLFIALAASLAGAAPQDWIVDTDAGTDDYLAIAYLLRHPGVRLEAITSVNGLSHARPGAEVAQRILELAGQRSTPVYAGAERPLAGNAAFPGEWRKMSEELPGVKLPALQGSLAPGTAADYLAARLRRPARILALGPLTNLALVLRKNPALARNIEQLVIMGGAVNVPGNLGDGDLFQTGNRLAEWNIFVDPQAAAEVFALVKSIRLVPLDATNKVPVRTKHIREFERAATGPLGYFVTQILQLDEPMIKDGYYYAWDPLAAMVAAEPGLFTLTRAHISISQRAGEEGRTVPGFQLPPNVEVLLTAPALRFHTEFFNAFAAENQRKIYDLLITGGHVIDAKNGVNAVRAVAIRDGKIAAVAERIPPERAAQVVDATGLYVTPGLVDIHVHVYASTGQAGVYNGDNSVYPDGHTLRAGVTTVVDCGSAGAGQFEDFKRHVIDRSKTRVLAWLNIVRGGMTEALEQQPALMQPAVAAAMAKRYPQLIVGIKTAHFRGPAWTAVDRALEAGRLAGLPIMVDFGTFRPERPYAELVAQKLRAGDMYTHLFVDRVPMFDARGRVQPFFAEARRRGVFFDAGHGGGSFVYRHAVPAAEQGLWPDSISTDLHIASMLGGMKDMLNVMSKFLNLGLPLEEVIAKSTWNPARQIRHEELGHLSVGAVADLAVLSLQTGRFGFVDVDGKRKRGDRKLTGELTLRAGEIVYDLNGLAADDWDER